MSWSKLVSENIEHHLDLRFGDALLTDQFQFVFDHRLLRFTALHQITVETVGSIVDMSAEPKAETEVQQIIGSGFVVRQQLIVQFLRLFLLAIAGERPGQHTIHVRIVFRLVVQTEQQLFCLIIPFQIGQADCLVQQI